MLMCFILSLLLAEQSPVACLALNEPMESYTHSVITSGPDVLYTDRTVVVDDELYEITNTEKWIFQSRGELRAKYDCLFAFAEYSDDGPGILTRLSLLRSGTDTLVLDIVQQDIRTDVIIQGNRWNTTECAPPFEIEEVLYSEALEYVESYFSYPSLKDSSHYTIIDAESETVTEQVLTKDAYTILHYLPPVFESVVETYLTKETNVCTDFEAQYDTVTEMALLTSAYETFEIHDASFETVTEQVLAQGIFRELQVIPAEISPGETILNLAPEYTTLTTTWIDGCDALGLTCVEYLLQDVPRRDTLLETGYYVCPQSFELENGLCSQTMTIPAQYTTRTYEKLVQPSTASTTTIEATYETLAKVLITNKSELPDSCITNQYSDRKLTLLSEPAIVDVQEVPASYETRAYQIMSAPPELRTTDDSVGIYYTKTHVFRNAAIGYMRALPEEFGRDSLLASIGMRLAELGYEGSTAAERLYQYLLSTDLPLMAITDALLDSLGLSITQQLDNDALLDSLPDKVYQKMINEPLSDGPYSFRQTILNANCQQWEVQSASSIDTDGSTIVLRSGTEVVGNIFQSAASIVLRSADFSTIDEVSTMNLDHCDSTYLLTRGTDPAIMLEMLDVYTNEEGRKVIEFDMPINTCHLPAANLQFIEGLGTNAGLKYEVVDGVVQGYMICSEADGEVVYRAPGFAGSCLSPLTAVPNYIQKGTVVYPNPTAGIVYLPEGSICVAVVDQQGIRHAVGCDEGVLDISQLPAGMYSITLLHGSTQYTHHRIVLAH